ncbi:MAG: dienelactone hydrolase family protein [Methanotrichaceae archaeon]|nr:dienelactone hydrolase family protein [Methanotrichaceae archaeon]
MRILLWCLIAIAFLGIAGCAQMSKNNSVLPIMNSTIEIHSENKTYPAYMSLPSTDGKWPAVIMIHSFNGLEPGYKTMADKFASEGFVVVAPEWQTFNNSPRDEIVGQLIKDADSYLKTRKDVNPSMIGLTGFCAGGRYTMLFLPQMDFKSGVAFYGFPYSGGFNNQSKPIDFISQLKVPMLIIHGTNDQASRISDIYRYATDLNTSNKYFELKVYQGEPHGFMIKNGQLSQSLPAKDAYWQMITFFNRTLK